MAVNTKVTDIKYETKPTIESNSISLDIKLPLNPKIFFISVFFWKNSFYNFILNKILMN